MSVKEKRLLMDKAIKEFTIPFLREQGFNGSYPHFRRIQDDKINLLTFQFGMSASRFVVEIANCPLTGIKMSWGLEILPAKCTAHDMFNRYRLGRITHSRDYWFAFDEASSHNIYKEKAKEIISLWDEAEKWWQEDPYQQRIPA